MKILLRLSISVCLIVLIFLTTSFLIKTIPTGQLILITGGSIVGIVAGIGLLLSIYRFLQHQASALQEKAKKKLTVALDTNILINAFLYKHPHYAKGSAWYRNSTYTEDDYKIMKLVESGEIIGFVPKEAFEQAKYALRVKYKVPAKLVTEFEKSVIKAGVNLYLKRRSRLSETQIKALSNLVHRKDEFLLSEALRKDCDVVVTGDRRFARDPSLAHYIATLYTEDFIYALEKGVRTKKELQKESFKLLTNALT